MTEQTKPQRTLLAILAHPDDESWGPGSGALAKYAHEGAAVHYLCGTRGEVGSADAEHLQGFESVGDMRWAELTCAVNELKFAGFYHLGFRDSGMAGSPESQHPQALAAQPVEAVGARIAHFIRQIKPQVVITHDTIGGYRHPDHIALNRGTLRAFEMLAEPEEYPDPEGLPHYCPQKLYYAIFSRRFMKFIVRVLPLLGQDPRRFGRNKDIDFASLVEVEFPVHAVIEVPEEARAMTARAAECHKSQHTSGPPRRGLAAALFRVLGRRGVRDTFMRVYPPVLPGEKVRETDLFEGVL